MAVLVGLAQPACRPRWCPIYRSALQSHSHNLQLPAVLAKPVLAAAMQDFVDSVNPTDGNDWLTLARAVQVIGAERFEDYVAAATADGPLVPETPDR